MAVCYITIGHLTVYYRHWYNILHLTCITSVMHMQVIWVVDWFTL